MWTEMWIIPVKGKKLLLPLTLTLYSCCPAPAAHGHVWRSKCFSLLFCGFVTLQWQKIVGMMKVLCRALRGFMLMRNLTLINGNVGVCVWESLLLQDWRWQLGRVQMVLRFELKPQQLFRSSPTADMLQRLMTVSLSQVKWWRQCVYIHETSRWVHDKM